MTDTPPEETAAPAEEAPAEAAVAVEEPVVEAEPVESDPVREALLAQLTGQFGDAIVGSHIARGDLWVRVANESWVPVIEFCRNTLGMRFFDFLAGLDWLNNTNLSGEKTFDPSADKTMGDIVTGYAGGDTRFQVFARLRNIESGVGLTLKVDLADDAPSVGTITHLFGGADWHEREAWEMYGFEFLGHAGLRHLYLPGAFEGHPMRKDFPLLAREIKPWPGLVDKEPMPGEEADGGDEEGGE